MDHCTEEDLILQFYGEHPRGQRVGRHLDACPACREAFGQLESTLALVVAPEAPPRDQHYGLEVWHRIRHRLPEQETGWRVWPLWSFIPPASAAAAVVLLVIAAFVAGRAWPWRTEPAVGNVARMEGIDPAASERARLAALVNHFDRSGQVLLDVVTADGQTLDVRDQQGWAADLLTANRLYRDASSTAGDEPVAGVLDELERVLLELVHGPPVLSPAELQHMRLRLDAAALLFKVRVMAETLRDRENQSPVPRTTT